MPHLKSSRERKAMFANMGMNNPRTSASRPPSMIQKDSDITPSKFFILNLKKTVIVAPSSLTLKQARKNIKIFRKSLLNRGHKTVIIKKTTSRNVKNAVGFTPKIVKIPESSSIIERVKV